MPVKNYPILVALLLVHNSISGQSFNIGHTSVTFLDSSRNRNIQAEIYYPSDNPGENVPIASGKFPVLVFGHGFLMSWESYQNFWEELVPKGYLMCFPTTEMGLLPNHENFGMDLKFVSAEMQLENDDSTSIFFNALAPKIGLLGHSMGGGASFLAAKNNTSISTLVSFAAAETNPSAIAAAANIRVPALVFSGDDDCVTPPEQNQDILYDRLSSDCKSHISIINGGHCYFANNNLLCTLGESSCNPSLNITREAQQRVTFDFLNLWLQYTLYDNQPACTVFYDSLQSSARIDYLQFCNTTSIHRSSDPSGFKIFPNPFNNNLNLELSEQNTGGLLTIYNITGKNVYQKIVNTSKAQLNFSKFPKGTYFAVYLKGSSHFSCKIIKTETN